MSRTTRDFAFLGDHDSQPATLTGWLIHWQLSVPLLSLEVVVESILCQGIAALLDARTEREAVLALVSCWTAPISVIVALLLSHYK